jgi:hypothetical protein
MHGQSATNMLALYGRTVLINILSSLEVKHFSGVCSSNPILVELQSTTLVILATLCS